MNRSNTIFLFLLAFMFWACAGTEQSTDNEADANTDNTEEVAEATDGAPSSVTTLNDSLPSPKRELKTTMLGTDIVITYGSPSVKDRNVWGELVPYGEVWRTGANEATTIETSGPISISGQNLPAGKYGFFTVPDENDWTLIFNEVADQWGHYNYDETKDVMRVKVVPRASEEKSETMEFGVEGENTIVLSWDMLQVPFQIDAGEAAGE